ncbi:ADP compounds hydrolase NudE [Alginatibacterium sediminis]|uniref:ADP compounds hydrolase NudE n=1 Tax=Alginatibacterium sediminis TaxID=2164068 RepID=A0A420E699_9ALTE|nr:ADP compounds hydrolase NudE [Alginatibacterium sediminis]RKF13187.1 ADP compounds hydrolase NudE [Alginatibacterium sediminis]
MRRGPPKIHRSHTVAQSRFFQIEALDLEFSNGEQRVYERLKGGGRGGVMVLPLDENDELILISEYAAGSERYELGFPKGLVDLGEAPLDAANRELQEEIGYKAGRLDLLCDLSVAPSYFTSSMSIYLGRDLSPSQLEGDEPEPLDQVRVPLAQIDTLLLNPQFKEARSVAALLMLERKLRFEQGDTDA